MGILNNENAIGGGNYQIANSLRFQSASSQYLSRTPASAGNRKTWTWSGWVKRGLLGTAQGLYATTNPVVGSGSFGFIDSPANSFYLTLAGIGTQSTTAVFRDPSAWYHVVLAFDSTQATQANRCKLYINGVQYTFTTNIVGLNTDYEFNNNTAQQIGTSGVTGGTTYTDGYLTEINFIDGQALTPSSFGETNTLTGQWVAKKYTGTYGTNGFYLPFSNGTSTTTLGYDSSGNSNNWTLNNFTRSAGVSDCWMYDVPSGNGSSVGGTQPNANYAVMNPLKRYTSNMAITNGNLTVSDSSNANTAAISSIRTPTTGKWYWEVTATTISSSLGYVVATTEANADATLLGGNIGGYRSSGTIQNLAGVSQTSGSSYVSGDVIGIAVDIDAGTCQFYKNNVAQGATPSFSFTAGTILVAGVATDNIAGTKTFNFNFGQRSFAYTPPSGFKALCTANLPTSTIVKGNQYMDATLYTGNGTVTGNTQTITNTAGFQPDLVWIKSRSSGTQFHVLNDTVRGANNLLYSNDTTSEAAVTNVFNSFNSNGFTVAYNTAYASAITNANGSTYVAWAWDAGSSTVTNTSGTISSQVRANPTAGVSVVTYTGTGANATVGHGLGVAPKMIICKARGTASNWSVYHQSLGNTKGIYLNITNAAATGSLVFWNNTTPTSSVFTLGSSNESNVNGDTNVAYCFAEIAGFSKFGSYTGNGSTDGVFCYTGFRPKYVMIKCSSAAGYDWTVLDTSRSPYNQANGTLYPSLSNAEQPLYSLLDFVSNGFKLRNSDPAQNSNGVTYIYMAFAESPFQNSNSR